MKNLWLTLAVASLFALTACAQKSNNQNQKGMKTLVAYFSATGTTEKVARQVAEAAGADLYKIDPVQPYTTADLDWTNKSSRSTVEMKDPKSRPAIKKTLKNADAYSVVYIGFPIWWYTAPTIINTFIETYNLNGKTVIPFATSGGSTVSKAAEDLKNAYPKINWKEGATLNRADKKDIEKWVAGNK